MLVKLLGINILGLILFVADRLSKIYFLKNPSLTYGGDFFYGLISFYYATNTGIAFGIKINQILISVIIILILVWLFKLLLDSYRDKNLLNILSLSLIIIGALSNLIDRFKYGFVIDYIDVRWFSIFNIADSIITIGIIIFGISISLFDNKKIPAP